MKNLRTVTAERYTKPGPRLMPRPHTCGRPRVPLSSRQGPKHLLLSSGGTIVGSTGLGSACVRAHTRVPWSLAWAAVALGTGEAEAPLSHRGSVRTAPTWPSCSACPSPRAASSASACWTRCSIRSVVMGADTRPTSEHPSWVLGRLRLGGSPPATPRLPPEGWGPEPFDLTHLNHLGQGASGFHLLVVAALCACVGGCGWRRAPASRQPPSPTSPL